MPGGEESVDSKRRKGKWKQRNEIRAILSITGRVKPKGGLSRKDFSGQPE